MLSKSRDQKRKSLFSANHKYAPHIPHILDVYAGERIVFIQLTNGELYSIGEGSYGELGLGK